MPNHKETSTNARMGYLLVLASALLAYSTINPNYNWDMIGYVASAYNYLGMEGQELHEKTYADVQSATDETEFAKLTAQDDDYRRTLYSDPEALAQQVHYKTRLIYVSLTILISFLVGTMSAATWIISAIAGAITLILLSQLIIRERLTLFLLFPIILAAAGLRELARLSTPDMLATMLAVIIVCVGLRTPRLAILLLPLIPAIRPDFIILVPLFAWVLYSREHRTQTIIAVIAAALIYFTINSFFNNYGYLRTFNFAVIHNAHPYPANIQLSPDLNDYIRPYMSGIRELFSTWKIAIIPLGTALAIFGGKFQRKSLEGFTVAAAVFVVPHFLLFPVGHWRYYFIATALSLIIIFLSATRLYHSLTRTSPHID
ncbi:MAG: hypothetical protein ACR2PR_02750 [Pseudohongiellaceae bacterium]